MENNNDGGKGKVQVRILGVHTEVNIRTGKNMGVPWEELPWAEVMGAPNLIHGGIGTYGTTGIPLQGTWVWIFFDGGDWNKPIICGIIYGTEDHVSAGAGFEDPALEYPEEDKVEEGTVRFAANRKVEETVVLMIREPGIDLGIPTAAGGEWDEHEQTTTEAEYPLNTAWAYRDGTFWEHDTTDGAKTQWIHNTGSYNEVIPDGSYTRNTVMNDTIIVYENSRRLVKMNETHTIFGESEYKIDLKQTILVGEESEETIMMKVTHLYIEEQETTVIGAVIRDYEETLDETVWGPVTEDYMEGQTTEGGPHITLVAEVINLN